MSRLGRGLMRSARSSNLDTAETLEDRSAPSITPHRPSGDRAINLLISAMATQVVLSATTWFWDAHQMSSARLMVAFALYHFPYAILIYGLIRLPGRTAFTYSIAVSGILILQTLLGFSIIALSLRQLAAIPTLLALPWLLHFAVLSLGWNAIQETGIAPGSSSMLAATAISFAYFLVVQISIPFTYIFVRR